MNEKIFDNINDLRKTINKIDEDILSLISKRLIYAKKSIKFKKSENEITNDSRKKEILSLIKKFAKSNKLPSHLISEIYVSLLSSFETIELASFRENEKNKLLNELKRKEKIKKEKIISIALVGNYDENIDLHKLIPLSLDTISNNLGINIDIEWLDTRRINIKKLKSFDAIWCTSGVPYKSTQGVLNAINFARVNNIPFLGTSFGYQHCLLEFARTELSFTNADSYELNKNTTMPLISKLKSKLIKKAEEINLNNKSKTAKIYKNTKINEECESSYGLNPSFLHIFDDSSMNFVGFNSINEVKVLEIKENDFFIATEYLPEKAILDNKSHPLIEEFLISAFNKNK